MTMRSLLDHLTSTAHSSAQSSNCINQPCYHTMHPSRLVIFWLANLLLLVISTVESTYSCDTTCQYVNGFNYSASADAGTDHESTSNPTFEEEEHQLDADSLFLKIQNGEFLTENELLLLKQLLGKTNSKENGEHSSGDNKTNSSSSSWNQALEWTKWATTTFAVPLAHIALNSYAQAFARKAVKEGSIQVCKVIVNNVFNDGGTGTGSGSEKVCEHVSSYFSREGSFFELLEDESQIPTPGP
jgi:hypothetical protein